VRSLDTHPCLVLQAPPGAGKTTAVPLALLLHQPEYLADKQTIMVRSA
jgi:ATP-dependent helicase HrpB